MYGWYDYHKNIKNVALSFMTEGIQWLKLIKTNKTFYRHITSLKYYFIKIIFYLIMHLYKDSLKIRRLIKKTKKVSEFFSLFLCVNIFCISTINYWSKLWDGGYASYTWWQNDANISLYWGETSPSTRLK